jgi:hypothetical protein
MSLDGPVVAALKRSAQALSLRLGHAGHAESPQTVP